MSDHEEHKCDNFAWLKATCKSLGYNIDHCDFISYDESIRFLVTGLLNKIEGLEDRIQWIEKGLTNDDV